VGASGGSKNAQRRPVKGAKIDNLNHSTGDNFSIGKKKVKIAGNRQRITQTHTNFSDRNIFDKLRLHSIARKRLTLGVKLPHHMQTAPKLSSGCA